MSGKSMLTISSENGLLALHTLAQVKMRIWFGLIFSIETIDKNFIERYLPEKTGAGIHKVGWNNIKAAT